MQLSAFHQPLARLATILAKIRALATAHTPSRQPIRRVGCAPCQQLAGRHASLPARVPCLRVALRAVPPLWGIGLGLAARAGLSGRGAGHRDAVKDGEEDEEDDGSRSEAGWDGNFVLPRNVYSYLTLPLGVFRL